MSEYTTHEDVSPLGIPYSRDLTYDLIEAGKRVADVLNEKIAHEGWWAIRNRFMAFRLDDGSTDGVLYDSKRDAVKHQKNEFHCAYICFRNLAGGASLKECAVFIKFHRDMYRAGFRMPDPDAVSGGRDVLMTSQLRDAYRRRLGI